MGELDKVRGVKVLRVENEKGQCKNVCADVSVCECKVLGVVLSGWCCSLRRMCPLVLSGYKDAAAMVSVIRGEQRDVGEWCSDGVLEEALMGAVAHYDRERGGGVV